MGEILSLVCPPEMNLDGIVVLVTPRCFMPPKSSAGAPAVQLIELFACFCKLLGVDFLHPR